MTAAELIDAAKQIQTPFVAYGNFRDFLEDEHTAIAKDDCAYCPLTHIYATKKGIPPREIWKKGPNPWAEEFHPRRLQKEVFGDAPIEKIYEVYDSICIIGENIGYIDKDLAVEKFIQAVREVEKDGLFPKRRVSPMYRRYPPKGDDPMTLLRAFNVVYALATNAHKLEFKKMEEEGVPVAWRELCIPLCEQEEALNQLYEWFQCNFPDAANEEIG